MRPRSANLLPRDGELYLFEHAIPPACAATWFEVLEANIRFTQEHCVLFGRRMPLPRRTAWFGDGAYRYSGILHPAMPMPPYMLPLHTVAESLASCRLNTVLLNRYYDGRDSVSWHSDDEGKAGLGPTIASLSFGATRRFLVRHRTVPDLRLALDLTAGSCLVMTGTMQQHWQHCVPKVRHAGPRINLTFRQINGPSRRPPA